MPELPEVETVVGGLGPPLLHNKISKIKLYRKDLRVPFPNNMQARLTDKKITSLNRRAKYILINFDGGDILVIHLGMSGRISIIPADAQHTLQKHDHMVLTMVDGARVIYNDPRRFGMVFIIGQNELETHKAFHHLGPEPLGNQFSALSLQQSLQNKKISIKQALLDQRVVVGVGNIYASEALFQAGINPQQPAGDIKPKKLEVLVIAIRDVLTRAIAAGGSTLKDYRHADGELGYFQHSFQVYDRAGQECPNCNCRIKKTGGIQKITQSGRSTFYCPHRQK